MPSTTTTTYPENSHAPATHGETSNHRSPVTDALYRPTQASRGVVSIPVARHHPEDGVPGSLDTRGDGQESAARHPVMDNHVHAHRYVPPQPIMPIQATLTRHMRYPPTPTTLQPGPSPPATRGYTDPTPSQQGRPNTNPVQRTQSANDDANDERRAGPQQRPLPQTSPVARASLKIVSLNICGRTANVNGVRQEKWFEINRLMTEHSIGILAIQETHMTDELEKSFRHLFSRRLDQQYLPNLYNKHGLTARTFAQQLQGLVYPPEVTTSCPSLYIICISGIWVGPHGPSLSARGSPS